ncbi:MAG TPA: hypothetical protein VHS09_15705, partial [Polyangiaceae bacterium]|nr:hypothetical protein [Polyangiaceae bacterium]
MNHRPLLPCAVVLALASAHCGSGSGGGAGDTEGTPQGNHGVTVGADGGVVTAHPDSGVSVGPSGDAGA